MVRALISVKWSMSIASHRAALFVESGAVALIEPAICASVGNRIFVLFDPGQTRTK